MVSVSRPLTVLKAMVRQPRSFQRWAEAGAAIAATWAAPAINPLLRITRFLGFLLPFTPVSGEQRLNRYRVAKG